jgi:hypothetical protein
VEQRGRCRHAAASAGRGGRVAYIDLQSKK